MPQLSLTLLWDSFAQRLASIVHLHKSLLRCYIWVTIQLS